jgi:signal transduction histidine kinase
MSSILRRRRTIHVPVTLSVVLMVLNVILMVCWIVVLAQLYWWSALALGTILFALALAGLVVYMILTIKEIHLNQRQSNFVDSVTHELKSPIASLKLYLETLLLREVPPEERQKFFRYMVQDLNRLDELITQLLEIGRLDEIVTVQDEEEVEMEPLLNQCAAAACAHYQQPIEKITLNVQPSLVRGRPLALEMIFRNLLDNAVKYAADDPRVDVEVVATGAKVVARISDNGAGVPLDDRSKIFQLFFRGGSELERKRKGTGLGLYIVHTLVRKLKGRVSVHGRGKLPGAVFEVELPGRAISCDS